MKRILTVLLTIALLTLSVPISVNAETVTVKIGGTNLVVDKYYYVDDGGDICEASDSLEDNYVLLTEDNETYVLSFKNFNYSYDDSNNPSVVDIYGNININIVGINTLSHDSEDEINKFTTVVQVNGDLTIDGDGTLTITNNTVESNCLNSGMSVYGGFVLRSGEISVTGANSLSDSFGIEVTDSLTLNGGKLTATGGDINITGDSSYVYSTGIQVAGNFIVYGGEIIASGGDIKGSNGNSTGISVNGKYSPPDVEGDDWILVANTGSFELHSGKVTTYGGKIDLDVVEGSGYSNGISVANNITIVNGEFDAIGGEVNSNGEDGYSCSKGFNVGNDVIIKNGVVNAIGGKTIANNGINSYGMCNGIYTYNNYIQDDGVVNIISSESSYISSGLFLYGDTTINGGELQILAGEGYTDSTGISLFGNYLQNNGFVNVKASSITADMYAISVGINNAAIGKSFTVKEGTLICRSDDVNGDESFTTGINTMSYIQDGGVVICESGDANGTNSWSFGFVYYDDSLYHTGATFTQTGGTFYAAGGSATGEGSCSGGINSDNVNVSNTAKFTVKGDDRASSTEVNISDIALYGSTQTNPFDSQTGDYVSNDNDNYKYLSTVEGGVPRIIDGANTNMKDNPESDLTIRSDEEINEFLWIEIDGVIYGPDSDIYDYTEGSTIVTLKNEFLSGLDDGHHDFVIRSSNGPALTKFSLGDVEQLPPAVEEIDQGESGSPSTPSVPDKTSAYKIPKTGINMA